jgi:hypothetical protein
VLYITIARRTASTNLNNLSECNHKELKDGLRGVAKRSERVTQIHTCLNCSAEIRTGPFCERCGQRNVHARLTFRDLLNDVRVQLLEWNLPWLYTIRAMLLRPGTVCREYMDGKRVRYVNPLKYLLYLMTVTLIVLSLLPGRYGIAPWTVLDGTPTDPDATTALIHNVVLRIVLLAPLMAVFFRLLYSRTKYNNAEVSCFILYALGNGVLLAALLNIFIEAIGQWFFGIAVVLSNAYAVFILNKVLIIVAVIFIHTTYTAAIFFDEAWYLSWIKVFTVYLVYGLGSAFSYWATSDVESPEPTPNRAYVASSFLTPLPWDVYEESLRAGLDEADSGFFRTSSRDYGGFLLQSGRTNASLYYILRGIEEDADDPERARYTRYLLATAYLRRGQHDFVLTVLNSGDAVNAADLYLETAIQRGQSAEILALADRMPAVSELNTDVARLWSNGDTTAALQRIRLVAGTPGATPVHVIFAARWAARLGDPELAWFLFETLEPRNKPLLWDSLWMPYFAEVRKLPAFKAFLREVGLVEYWRVSGIWADQCRPLGDDDDFECF